MTAPATLTPGFSDPPLQAQGVFRLVLDAMARPGRIKALGDEAPKAPAPLDDTAFAAALTLFDFETPVWIDDLLATPDVVESLRFHCGCPIVAKPGDAAFALIGDTARMPSLSSFSLGTPDYPDRAATLIIQTEGLAEGEGWTLRGPGIKDCAKLRVLGLPLEFEKHWSDNRAGFPNGVDVVFTHGRQFACLPRTTALEV